MNIKWIVIAIFSVSCSHFTKLHSQTKQIEDHTSPYMECSKTSKGLIRDGMVEVFAKDFVRIYTDSFNKSDKLAFTFNSDYPVVSLIDSMHYFANGVESTIKEYQSEMAQKWHPEYNTSSRIFTNQTKQAITFELVISCFDEAKNSANCRTFFVVTE